MADLYISEETADDIETAAVDAALDGRFVVVRESERLIRAGTSARHGYRHLLLPALHALLCAALRCPACAALPACPHHKVCPDIVGY